VVRVRRAWMLGVLATSVFATVPAFGQSAQESTKTLLTLSGSNTAVASVVINGKFSLKGLNITTKGTYAGYELKDKHGSVVAWALRLPALDETLVEVTAASFPAGTYQATLVTNASTTVSIQALTAAAHKTIRPHTHADFTFASQTVSSPVQGAARVPFTVPKRYGLIVQVIGLTHAVDVATYEKDCITTAQLCEASSGPGLLFQAPGGPGSNDSMTLQEDYQPGDLAPGATNAVVEYAAASETASATSAIIVFS
jgi:hypothetical protein